MALPERNLSQVEYCIRDLLVALGEDISREGLRDTPKRVAALYSDILDGAYAQPIRATAFKETTYKGLIMVHHVPFYAFCEHHLLPFIGTAAIGYIPHETILGLSKLVRLFRQCAKHVTIQERLTQNALNALTDAVNPLGAIVYVEAEHMCMSLRGVKSPGAKTTTVAYTGVFSDDVALRNQFILEVSK